LSLTTAFAGVPFLGRTAEAQTELAEFQRLKDMKDRLKQVYTEMRLQPVKQERLDKELVK